MKHSTKETDMNPFDDDSGTFLVLRNTVNQHSLWPTFASIPDGWEAVYGPTSRPDALAWIDAHWIDITPQT